MKINTDDLREDLLQNAYGAFFAGGHGGALVESFDIEDASPEELIEMAEEAGFDLEDYESDD